MCDNIFFEFSNIEKLNIEKLNIEKLRNTLIIPKRKSSLDYQYNFYIKRCTLPSNDVFVKGNFTEKYINDPINTIIDLYQK